MVQRQQRRHVGTDGDQRGVIVNRAAAADGLLRGVVALALAHSADAQVPDGGLSQGAQQLAGLCTHIPDGDATLRAEERGDGSRHE